MERSPSWEANSPARKSRNPAHFVELGGLLPPSQQLATCPYHQPHQFSPSSHPASWRSILILFFHLRLGIPSGLFPSGILTKTPYSSLLSPIRYICLACLILLRLITRIVFDEEERKICRTNFMGICVYLLQFTEGENNRNTAKTPAPGQLWGDPHVGEDWHRECDVRRCDAASCCVGSQCACGGHAADAGTQGWMDDDARFLRHSPA